MKRITNIKELMQVAFGKLSASKPKPKPLTLGERIKLTHFEDITEETRENNKVFGLLGYSIENWSK